MRAIFQEICAIQIADGMIFGTERITAEAIVGDADYPGVRVRIPASLAGTRDVVQVDVAFGDIVTPGPHLLDFPVLLDDMTTPHVQTYSTETVVAEKFEAMISLALANGRLKDFFDVYQLAHAHTFNGALLQQAVANTFNHRGARFQPDHPLFEVCFGADPERQRHWTAFLRRTGLDGVPRQFDDVVAVVREFLLPLYEACASGKEFTATWSPDTRKWSDSPAHPSRSVLNSPARSQIS